METVVCFDIGGTAVKYGLLDLNGKILEKSSFDTNIKDSQEILNNMSKIINNYIVNKNVVGISISSPGFVNTNTGEIVDGTIIEGFIGLNIKKYFEDKYKLPVAVDNDANCATIAEHKLGNGTDCKNMVCVTIGTGIGGGIYINNKLLRGSTFQGGEFGFMRCNEKGMYSNIASTLALIKEYMKYKNLDKAVDGQVVFNDGEKDSKVKEIINEWYGLIATGIYNLSATLNPEKILIGGGVSEREEFIEEVVNALEKIEAWNDVKCVIERCKHKNDAGMIGAVYNLLNE